MEMKINSVDGGFSGGGVETISFKAWYPDDSTLRITGRGMVKGTQAELELRSELKPAYLPL